jgi:hypothetical protein
MIVAIIAGHYFLHFRWETMKFPPKEEKNLCLHRAAFRIWRLIGDVPGWCLRAIRFDIGFSPRFSLSNHGQRGIDTDSGDPRGELAGLTKSSQVSVGAEQGLLQGIFGILMVTDDGKNSSPDSLSVPPAQLSKGLVVTRLSRPNKIIIGAQCIQQWIVMAAMRRHDREWGCFEPPSFVSSTRFRSL